ncbi:hypothetical protein NHX12_034313 [Muraenolepis orangiensis]|uniref:Interleukin-1 n=1 Tax=Muraenolepis orangiensis TaxID=630683 RepID=A0A9Q0I095_9TELE|nr:hypothetical protein NHX12_034313 [Muraenolepis orangiensis]
MEFQCECISMKRTSSSERWSGRMPQGMDLERIKHPLTMRQVVNLVIAVDRLDGRSHSKTVRSSEFRDEDLINILLESAVEERLVLELTEAPPQGGLSRMDPACQCTLTDTQKRNMILVRETMELHAIRLQGGSKDREVSLNMSTYLDPMPSAEAQPVTLGIRGTKLYLSCSEIDDKPTLNLEEVQDKEELRRISKASDMARFLFYKSDTGVSASTLMSARYSGWYISTAHEENLPIDMCQQSASRYQNFTVRQS